MRLWPGGEEAWRSGGGRMWHQAGLRGWDFRLSEPKSPAAGEDVTTLSGLWIFPKHSVTHSLGLQMPIGAGRGHEIEEGLEDRGRCRAANLVMWTQAGVTGGHPEKAPTTDTQSAPPKTTLFKYVIVCKMNE